MRERDLLTEAFERLPDLVVGAVDGLTPEQLQWTPAPKANSIGWLVWHLSRIQDDHVAELIGVDQEWTVGAWAPKFGLPPNTMETGYGHRPADIARVRPESASTLVDYYFAVAERTRTFLDEVTAEDLDRVVDERWDPPVTLGVRLISVLDDDTQHVGQAAYVRGLLPR